MRVADNGIVRTILILPLLCVLAGCTHPYIKKRTYLSFEEQGEKRAAKMERYTANEDGTKRLFRCAEFPMNSKNRMDCLSQYMELGKAKTNTTYDLSDSKKVNDAFIIGAERNTKNFIDFDLSNMKLTQEQRIKYTDLFITENTLFFYETLSRISYACNWAALAFQNHSDSVDKYNASVDAEREAWERLANSTQSINTDQKIDQLQRQQKYLLWQQQSGGKGIRPFNTY